MVVCVCVESFDRVVYEGRIMDVGGLCGIKSIFRLKGVCM